MELIFSGMFDGICTWGLKGIYALIRPTRPKSGIQGDVSMEDIVLDDHNYGGNIESYIICQLKNDTNDKVSIESIYAIDTSNEKIKFNTYKLPENISHTVRSHKTINPKDKTEFIISLTELDKYIDEIGSEAIQCNNNRHILIDKYTINEIEQIQFYVTFNHTYNPIKLKSNIVKDIREYYTFKAKCNTNTKYNTIKL